MPLLFGEAAVCEVPRASRAAMKAQGPSTRAPSLRPVALARDDKAVRCIPGLMSGASTVGGKGAWRIGELRSDESARWLDSRSLAALGRARSG